MELRTEITGMAKKQNPALGELPHNWTQSVSEEEVTAYNPDPCFHPAQSRDTPSLPSLDEHSMLPYHRSMYVNLHPFSSGQRWGRSAPFPSTFASIDCLSSLLHHPYLLLCFIHLFYQHHTSETTLGNRNIAGDRQLPSLLKTVFRRWKGRCKPINV